MSLQDYAEKLKRTNMFQDELIAISEYNYKSFLGALLKPPPLPIPDANTHYIIIKMNGERPAFVGVLTDKQRTYQPTSQDNGRLLFIAVDMKYQTIKISGSRDGFMLKDGHYIHANFEVVYRVDDVERFWGIADDPPKVLESQVINAASNFFLNISSINLIQNSYDVKQDLEGEIYHSGLNFTKEGLERDIKRIDLDGISLSEVYATVNLSEELKNYVRRQHEKLYSQDGKMDIANTRKLDLTERKHIDELIDQDTTFGQWGLREIVMSLNVELLNNFYTETWHDAMQKVFQAVEAKKREMLKSQQDANIERLKKRMRQAQELGLGEEYMEEIREKLAVQFLDQVDEEENGEDSLPSNEKLFTMLIGPSTNPNRQISDGNRGQIEFKDADD